MRLFSKYKLIVAAIVAVLLALIGFAIVNRAEISGRLAVRSLNSQVDSGINCGSEAINRATTDHHTFNSCFENAFKSCEPAYTEIGTASFWNRFVVLGKDNKTGKCIGGQYYSKAAIMDGDHLGTGFFCQLDTTKQDFDTAFQLALDSSTINDGTTNTPDSTCTEPLNAKLQ